MGVFFGVIGFVIYRLIELIYFYFIADSICINAGAFLCYFTGLFFSVPIFVILSSFLSSFFMLL